MMRNLSLSLVFVFKAQVVGFLKKRMKIPE